jgi:nitronate monooxygenase
MDALGTRAGGDDTLRSSVIDTLKGYDFWSARYDLRTLKSAATDRWAGKEAELRAVAEVEVARYAEAAAKGDARQAGATVGEAIGLIHGIAPAGTILRTMIDEAEGILKKAPAWIAT